VCHAKAAGQRRPARDAGIGELEIVVDSHEQYPDRFIHQQVSTIKQALPFGDCGVRIDGSLVASVERKPSSTWWRA